MPALIANSDAVIPHRGAYIEPVLIRSLNLNTAILVLHQGKGAILLKFGP